jgi:hypothetical protein
MLLSGNSCDAPFICISVSSFMKIIKLASTQSDLRVKQITSFLAKTPLLCNVPASRMQGASREDVPHRGEAVSGRSLRSSRRRLYPANTPLPCDVTASRIQDASREEVHYSGEAVSGRWNRSFHSRRISIFRVSKNI